MSRHSAFWDDLARDLEDRRFREAYVRTSLRIASVDLVVNTLRRFTRRQEREA
jgi:hypothetical protein